MAQEMQPIEENYPALDINLSLTFSSQGYNSIGSVEPIRKYTKPILPSGLVKTPDNDEEEESIPIENKDGLIYFYSQETHPLCARENDAREIIRTQNLQVSDNQLTELLRPERQQVVNPAEAQQLPPCKLYTCKMLICVTMYAEDLDMLQKTLFHIQRNLDEFKKAGVDPKQVVVVVLQDGILKMKEETARWMAELENGYNYTQSIQRRQEHYQMKDFKNVIDRRRLLQSEILKYQLSGLKQYVEKNSGLPPNLPSRTALLYQVRKDYSRFLPDYKQQFKNVDPNSYIPLTTFFLNKHLNARKLSSHLWFFEGFCKFFTPQYITLVDVGTLPERTGIAEYFYAMERDKSLGGASGYMGLYMKDEEDAKVRAALDVNQRTEFDRKLQEEEARENQPFELRKRYEEERDKQKVLGRE